MRTYLLLIAVAVAGCGPSGWTSKHGVHATDYTESGSSIGPNQASELEEWTADELALYGYDKQETLRSMAIVELVIQEKNWRCIGKDAECAGQEFGRRLWVANKPCHWWTAYRHELTHFIHERNGVVDYNHTRPEWQMMNKAHYECDAMEHSNE